MNLVHVHVHHTPFPSTEFLFEGEAYGLPWTSPHAPPVRDKPLVPSIDHANFLINNVRFHCTQLLHLFDEEEFNTNVQAYYSSSEDTSSDGQLWYTHFLVIIALGKALSQHRHREPRPPGAVFFEEALQRLPDTDTLCREPIEAMEILCCIALYQHALDARNSAHVTVCTCNIVHFRWVPVHIAADVSHRSAKLCVLDRQTACTQICPWKSLASPS